MYLKDDPVVGFKGVDLRILKAWDKTVGSSSVVVGVIEAGEADLAHPDLAGALWVNSGEIANNGIDDDHNGLIDDRNGFDFVDGDGFNFPEDHGTHILGTIAAKKGNNLGGSGVAPGVKVMALRANAKDNTVIEAINYAKSKGVKIVNLSQGGLDYFNDAVRAKLAAETSMLFICSAGNFAGAQYNYPSSYDLPNVLSIANIDNLARVSPNSNVGEVNVDIAAPGAAIWSTVTGDGYDRETGTSQAAANVSGVAALLLSSEPTLTPTGIVARLQNTAMRYGKLNRLTKIPAIVDAEAALNDVLSDGSMVDSGASGRRGAFLRAAPASASPNGSGKQQARCGEQRFLRCRARHAQLQPLTSRSWCGSVAPLPASPPPVSPSITQGPMTTPSLVQCR